MEDSETATSPPISNSDGANAWTGFLFKVIGLLAMTFVVWGLPWVFLGRPAVTAAAALLLIGGIYLGFFGQGNLPETWMVHARRGTGVLLAVSSLWLLSPTHVQSQIPWKPYSETALQEAAQQGKPALIDFYASWCGPCKAMERYVFSRRDVGAAARRFVALRADMTRSHDPRVQELGSRYQIEGLPTIVFLDRQGQENRDLRVLGLEKANRFIERLKSID